MSIYSSLRWRIPQAFINYYIEAGNVREYLRPQYLGVGRTGILVFLSAEPNTKHASRDYSLFEIGWQIAKFMLKSS